LITRFSSRARTHVQHADGGESDAVRQVGIREPPVAGKLVQNPMVEVIEPDRCTGGREGRAVHMP
jgi:hypothetical protein